ncbi:MAG: LysR family transcriptional regulator [Eubacteriales bacterium]|nr:LysR family transcriptional regulator [Eubacteriales bacterium]
MDHRLMTFLTLCRTMHYGKAAEILNLSQPAVSKHIQSLENEYSVRLFIYGNRKLKKTEQGAMLEQYASLMRYHEEHMLSAMHAPNKRLLRIGATKSVGDYILLPEIKRFLSNPSNDLEFLVDNTANLLHKLEAGQLDFVVLEGPFNKQRYGNFRLRMESYVGICHAKHPFNGREVQVEELFSQCLMLREWGSGTRNILERGLTEAGYDLSAFKNKTVISSFKLMKELVADGLGISFLYETVIEDDPRFGRFSCPPMTGEHELNVVFLKNTQVEKAAKDFLFNNTNPAP